MNLYLSIPEYYVRRFGLLRKWHLTFMIIALIATPVVWGVEFIGLIPMAILPFAMGYVFERLSFCPPPAREKKSEEETFNQLEVADHDYPDSPFMHPRVVSRLRLAKFFWDYKTMITLNASFAFQVSFCVCVAQSLLGLSDPNGPKGLIVMIVCAANGMAIGAMKPGVLIEHFGLDQSGPGPLREN